MKRNNNKGFTLAELLIVVAVIAVLVAVAIPTFTEQLEKSRQSVDESNLRGAYAAARLAEIDQKVGEETFKDAAGDPADTAKLIYWYDPDSGTLTKATESQTAEAIVNKGLAQYGKATKATTVADFTQLSFKSLSTDYASSLNSSPAGTRDKAILVQFGKISGQNGYGIASIKFVTTANGDSNATAVPVGASASTAVPLYATGEKEAEGNVSGAVTLVKDGTPAEQTVSLDYPLIGDSASINLKTALPASIFTLPAGVSGELINDGTGANVTYAGTGSSSNDKVTIEETGAEISPTTGTIAIGNTSAVAAKTTYTIKNLKVTYTLAGTAYFANLTLKVTAKKSITVTAITSGVATATTANVSKDTDGKVVTVAELLVKSSKDSAAIVVTAPAEPSKVSIELAGDPVVLKSDDSKLNGITASAVLGSDTLTLTLNATTDVGKIQVPVKLSADGYADKIFTLNVAYPS